MKLIISSSTNLLALAASFLLFLSVVCPAAAAEDDNKSRAVRGAEQAPAAGGNNKNSAEKAERGFKITLEGPDQFKTVDVGQVRRLQEEVMFSKKNTRALKSKGGGRGDYPFAPLFQFEIDDDDEALINFLEGAEIVWNDDSTGDRCFSTQCIGVVEGVVEGEIEDECAVLVAAVTTTDAFEARIVCLGPLDIPFLEILACDDSLGGDCGTDILISPRTNGFTIELDDPFVAAIVELKCCTPFDL